MGKSNETRRNRLPVSESRLDLFFIELSYDGEYHLHRHKRRQTSDNRRNQGRNENLRNHRAEIDALYASTHDHSAHKTAEQSMRRAGRQADKPGKKIPDNGTYKAGEYEFWTP